ncbi:MAG: hypothetical protein ABSC77_07720 [Terracidiphilus sp.]|jgi:hypothetical protein
MTEAIQTIPTPIEASEPIDASANPAVARCMSAWKHVNQRELAKGKSEGMAAHYADQAYRRALPPLSGQDNIRDFIACVAYGLLIDAINNKTGPKLLYAAQIAYSTVRSQSAPPKTAAT